jgi:uncharacterized protein involved in exopolysaccharide biosynthesis
MPAAASMLAAEPRQTIDETVERPPARHGLTPRDLVCIAFYHRRIVVICVLLGLIVGTAAALYTKTQYTADTLLIVLIGRESASPQDVVGIGPGNVNIDGLKVLQSEISIIESVDVIERALMVVGPANVFPEVAGPRLFGLLPARPPEQQLARAAELLRRRLFASDSQNTTTNAQFNGSNIMRVQLTLPDRTMVVRTLGAIVAAYLEHRRELYGSPGSRFLVAELDKTSGQLTGVEAQIERVRAEYHVLDITQDIASAGTRMDAVLARENAARERQQAVQAELASATERRRQTPERVFDSHEATNQAPNDETRNTLLKLQLERAHLATQYAPTYPALIELDRKIAAVNGALKAEANRPGSFTQRDIRNPSADLLTNRITALQGEDSALANQLAELGRQFTEAQARAAQLRQADARLHDLQRQRDMLENVQRQISLREANVRVQDSVTASRNTNINVVQPPSAPFTGSYMGFSYLAAAGFAGLMAGLAAGLVAARLRQVYVVPREAERDLSLTELGDFAESDHGFDTPTAHAEIGNLASLLLDETQSRSRHRGRDLTMIQVSGIDARATVALAHALSTEFAGRHGLRTLFMDADAEGAQRKPGTAATNSAEWAATPNAGRVAAVPGDVPGLWLAANAAPALLRGRVREFDPSLHERCDIVLVASSGGARDHAVRRLASLADCTVMVVVAEQTPSQPACELRDALIAAGGLIAGFVFIGRKSYIPRRMEQWI